MNTTKLLFNPFSAEFHKNPYPTYDRLRNEDPIHWSFLKAWVITCYDDTEAIVKDTRFQVDDLPIRLQEKNAYLEKGDLDTLSKTIDKWLFFQQVPDHTRFKGLVSKVFSPTSLEVMRPVIQENVNKLLAKVKHTGKMDLIGDLASPLPAITITNILGLPPEDFEKLIPWSHDLLFIFDQPMSLEGYQRQNQAVIEARDYFLQFMTQQRQNPRPGLISQLQTVEDPKNSLTEDEILGVCLMLLVAVLETTKSFIANAILALLQHREKLEELKCNPNLINQAVEELLRYDTPAQMITRLAREDVVIRDKTIAKGDRVILCLGAANRDPVQFSQPDTINFQRQNRNLPFGGGSHFCLGAFLARLQGQIAINTLIQDLPNLQLATDTNSLEWIKNTSVRGLKSLPLTFDYE